MHGPELAPVGYPAALAPLDQRIIARDMPQPASANSRFGAVGARTFFNDQRANKVGDILTVQINIDDSAKTTNTTSSSRTAGMQGRHPAPAGPGDEPGQDPALGAYDPGQCAGDQLGDQQRRRGAAVNRQEKISLTVAAVVSAVLPNGNLVIQGTQEVRTNNDVRQLTVAGIVRPEDISSSNTIQHTQIAEARISYGGRGDISRVQKTPAGQALIERFSPF